MELYDSMHNRLEAVYDVVLFNSRFGFKSGICLLIAPVPVHCFSISSNPKGGPTQY